MKIIKIISSEDANIFIDQEEVCVAEKNKLVKFGLEPGVYILEAESKETGSKYSEDLEIDSLPGQILKRINFQELHVDFNDLLRNGEIDSIDQYGIIKSHNLFGVIGSNNELIIPLRYDSIRKYDNYFIAQKDGYNILFNLDGCVIIPKYLDLLSNNEDRIVALDNRSIIIFNVKKNKISAKYECDDSTVLQNKEIFPVKNSSDRYGFMNFEGNILIDFLYEEAGPFDTDINMALVSRYNIFHYIDKRGYICTLNDIDLIRKCQSERNLYWNDNRLSRYYSLIRPHDGLDWIGRIEVPDENNMFISSRRYISICNNGLWAYTEVRANDKEQYLFAKTSFYQTILHDARFGFPVFYHNEECVVVNLIEAKYRNEEKEKLKKGHGLCPGLPMNPTEADLKEIAEWEEVERKIKSIPDKLVYGKIGEELFRYKCLDLIPVLKRSGYFRDFDRYPNWVMDFVYNIKYYFFKDSTNKYGVLDEKGNIIISPKYDNIFSLSTNEKRKVKDLRNSNQYIVEISGLYGLLNESFELIVDCQYEEIEYINNNLYALRKSGEWKLFIISDKKKSDFEVIINDDLLSKKGAARIEGYKDYIFQSRNGFGVVNDKLEIIIPFEFDEIYRGEIGIYGSEGTTYFMVRKGSNWGAYDGSSKLIVPCFYPEVKPNEGMYYGLILSFTVKNQDSKFGVYSLEGEKIIDLNYDKIEAINDSQMFTILSYKVFQNNKIGIINHKGHLIFPCSYRYIELYEVSYEEEDIVYKVETEVDGLQLFGLYDECGATICCPKYDYLENISYPNEDLFIFRENNSSYFGALDYHGQIILGAVYNSPDEVKRALIKD